eukprot:TRINITY_DN14325_c0_g1_i1.p2 TRINITY_DN14325_c0_g1~~TRINITY_DN14325_c0_g1_i1.p2  ORF type:complete len:167 (+),score=48.80 TRINITY_DN14325_c0_g1_i1:83-583(+)
MREETDEEMAVAQLASLIQIDMSDARRALEWANWDQTLAIEKAFAQIADAPACPATGSSNTSVSAASEAQATETPAAETAADPNWSAVESPTQARAEVASALAAEQASEAEAFRSESSDENRPRRGLLARLWYGGEDDARSQVQEPPAVERLAEDVSTSGAATGEV